MIKTLYHKIRSSLFSPVDISSVAFFRIAFGAFMFYEVYRYIQAGWIWNYFMSPKFYFGYKWFEWVTPWDKNGMIIHFLIMGVLAIFVMIGFMYRVSAFLFFLAFTYIFLLDQSNYLNHFYLISLVSFLMVIIPAHRNYSVDVALRPHIKSSTIPSWALWILMFQIGIAYFFGGIAKINPDWLQGEPMGMWLSKQTDFPLIGKYFTNELAIIFISRAGILLDLFIVPFLLYKPTRVIAFIFISLFHLMNAKLWSIGIFPWFMIAATTLYFRPEWPRKLLDKVTFKLPEMANTNTDYYNRPGWRNATIIFLIVFCSWQTLYPLRHFMIPGNVNWTEEGHRFAWHMKLRDKKSEITFFATDNTSNKTWEIDILSFLTPRQANDMSTHPFMMWQFAQKLKNHYSQEEGITDLSIKTIVLTSLNGREKQLYIDSELDLAKLESYEIPAPWIYPLKTSLRSGKNINKINLLPKETESVDTIF